MKPEVRGRVSKTKHTITASNGVKRVSNSQDISSLYKSRGFGIWLVWNIQESNTMPRRKDLKQLFFPSNLERVIRSFPTHFEVLYYTLRRIIHMWKTSQTAANLLISGHPSKFTPRSMIREKKKKIQWPQPPQPLKPADRWVSFIK